MKIKKIIIFLCLGIFLSLGIGQAVLAQDQASASNKDIKLEVNFFYSAKCPHCQAEQKFLDVIAQKYPQVIINRYAYDDPVNQQILRDLCKKSGAERYIGLVPLTFVGKEFFLGFDSNQGIGVKIEQSIIRHQEEQSIPGLDGGINVPFIGEVSSLILASALLGGFDGFNVCSLGALALILGLVLSMKSRAKIAIFGGIFVLTTAVAYGILIVLWYKLFTYFSGYLWLMEVLLGLLGLGGGIYFLRQFLKSRNQALVCEQKQGGVITKVSSKLQGVFDKPRNLFLTFAGVFLFALVVTVVEFPCSALVPVTYAGLLAQSDLSTFQYLLHIAVYIFFYMLDEIIVLVVAIATMKLWITSGKFTKWAVLGESLVLFTLGIYYLIFLI